MMGLWVASTKVDPAVVGSRLEGAVDIRVADFGRARDRWALDTWVSEVVDRCAGVAKRSDVRCTNGPLSPLPFISIIHSLLSIVPSTP